MIANINDSPIVTYNVYPDTYNNTLNYPATDPSVKIADGWRNVVVPVYDVDTQYLGAIFYDGVNDYFTYPVINKTTIEIQAEKQATQVQAGEQLTQTLEKNTIIRDQQAILDPNVNLLNMAIFPFWLENFNYAVNTKAQYFDVNNDIQLYVCIDNNISTNAAPYTVPGLWSQVVPDNVNFYPWHPPLQFNTYMLGARVTFEAVNYESTIDNNLYAPGIIPGEWIVSP